MNSHPRSPDPTGFAELASRAEARRAELGMDVGAFGERVGREMRDALADPESFWLWNGDGLHGLCAELGVCWLDALPRTPAPPHVPRPPWMIDPEA